MKTHKDLHHSVMKEMLIVNGVVLGLLVVAMAAGATYVSYLFGNL